MRVNVFVIALNFALIGWLAANPATTVVAQERDAASMRRPGWSEVKWPFALDQWGIGRAFECAAAECGAAISLYLRPKLGFCNCTIGVADDTELDRVGDLELLGERFEGLAEGQLIAVGSMKGRSRAYQVQIPYAPPATVIAIAFNDKCDVVVATVVADRRHVATAQHAALEFLNGDLVRRWIERELGL
jgi:hypothetical protein